MSPLLLAESLTARLFSRWHGIDIRMARDNFRIGYSNASLVCELNIEAIKLDRHFINKLPIQSATVKIIRALVGLRSPLGMSVVPSLTAARD
jgi:diguanylate cyclase